MSLDGEMYVMKENKKEKKRRGEGWRRRSNLYQGVLDEN
jgi:hypothetical protein